MDKEEERAYLQERCDFWQESAEYSEKQANLSVSIGKCAVGLILIGVYASYKGFPECIPAIVLGGTTLRLTNRELRKEINNVKKAQEQATIYELENDLIE